MIGSDAYNYINVLNTAADASWMRNSVITNNRANVDRCKKNAVKNRQKNL